MLCILCVTPPKQEKINIFGKEGLALSIGEIISKHFWLQPNVNDDNAKIICSFCWNSLNSFDKFYAMVEKAHATMSNIDIVKEESPSNDCSDPLTISVKEEIYVDSIDHLQQLDAEKSVDHFASIGRSEDVLQDTKSDSESEIPLSHFTRSHKLQKKKKVEQKKVPDDGNQTSKVIPEWKATCYSEENNKRVTTEESDEFIKRNLDLSCTICYQALGNFVALQEHYEFVHYQRGYAACCGKKFDKRGALVDHILMHKYPEYFKCDKCQKSFACRRNLKEHQKTHNKKLIYKCDECGKAFHRRVLLKRHMDVHVTDRTFKCEECDKLFASKFALGQHTYGVHKGGYTKICDQCGKVARDREAFRLHQLEHTGEPKTFVECKECGVKLASKSGLRRHIRSQHVEAQIPQVCNICGAEKTGIFALKRHITYMHKYERTFKCPMCEKAFKTAIVLKVSVFTYI